MAVILPSKNDIEFTKNMIHSSGEVVALETDDGLVYALPGGSYTRCKKSAEAAAKKMNDLIQYNKSKYRRKM